jgi:hypothetical protein
MGSNILHMNAVTNLLWYQGMVAGNNSCFGVQFIPERGCENEYPVKQLESEKNWVLQQCLGKVVVIKGCI